MGEPHRAFYGNQYSLTFPLFEHFRVPLWVPEVGGAIDPGNAAHDMIMGVFGGLSKGERNRVKIGVRSAMAAITATEGRYLGGRPPYGYELIDAGPHPNPAKAADGKRLRRLVPHPAFSLMVKWIFAQFIGGRGIFDIAEELTREGVPSPSAADPGRNRHRVQVAWSKSAVRVIITNPRYTGHQVWNKQRKDEVLLDVDDVALGHTTKLRWNDRDQWVWSEQQAHEPLVSVADFERAQAVLASRGRGQATHKPHRTRRPYAFRGCLHCGCCERRMQGNWNNDQAYYRCRFPVEAKVDRAMRDIRAPKTEQLRILLLGSSSERGERALCVGREQKRIRKAVESALLRDYVELDVRPAATTEDLLDGITKNRPHVVHFSGHSDDDLIEFEEEIDDYHKGVVVTARAFASAVRATDDPPLLVLLNSCNSAAQIDRLVQEQIAPFAIGMADEIEDGDAIIYAAQFYAAVANGQSIRSAHLSAQAALELAGLASTELPTLAHADDVDPATAVLVNRWSEPGS